MGKAIRFILLIFSVLMMVGVSVAAERVKFKPQLSLYSDDQGGGLRQPEGVACGLDSFLVVADTGNGRLIRYSSDVDSLMPGPDIVLPQLPYPIRVQVNSKGDIFALDGKLRRITHLSASGEFIEYVEPSGLKSPSKVVPRSFHIDRKDNIYILDILSGRVLVLDPAGKSQREIPFPDNSGFFSDLAVDPNGNIFLIDSVRKKVFFAPKDSGSISAFSESLKGDLDFPTGIATDASGRIYVVDQNGDGIIVLGQDGSFQGRRLSMGWNEGFLRYPSQICVDNKGTMFVADRGNNRIQIFSTIQ